MEKVMEFVDTHCHIQFTDYGLDPDKVVAVARQSGVTKLIVVGCTLADSQAGAEFAGQRDGVWASIGLHPHEASRYAGDEKVIRQLDDLASESKVVAIGEIGLDYYYLNSPKQAQKKLFESQLKLAIRHDLPLIFHVRDAFDDFWSIFDKHNDQNKPIRGVVHSFSSDINDLEQILSRDLHIGLNGIMTFTRRKDQLEAARVVPLDSLVLETDAPFLTPVPFRGKIGEPKYVRTTGEFLANLRGESLEDLASVTTANAKNLFSL